MKKRLVLVGNKPFNRDLSAVIDGFDYVVRVNRMNNLGASGSRIDGYYLGLYDDFIFEHRGGEHVAEIRRARQVFATKYVQCDREHIFDFISREQFAGLEVVDRIGCLCDTAIPSPTSTIVMLWHLLSTRWASEYDITLTGIDVEGRGRMFETMPEWSTTGHRTSGHAEEEWLRGLIEGGKINFLDC